MKDKVAEFQRVAAHRRGQGTSARYSEGMKRFALAHAQERMAAGARDPILFAGGQANLYAYVGNDPVNMVDPSGLLNPVKAGVGVVNRQLGARLILCYGRGCRCSSRNGHRWCSCSRTRLNSERRCGRRLWLLQDFDRVLENDSRHSAVRRVHRRIRLRGFAAEPRGPTALGSARGRCRRTLTPRLLQTKGQPRRGRPHWRSCARHLRVLRLYVGMNHAQRQEKSGMAAPQSNPALR